MILMEDFWKLSHGLNIYKCHHVYRQANRIADYLVKKVFVLWAHIFGGQFSSKMLLALVMRITMVLISKDFVSLLLRYLSLTKKEKQT